MSMKNQDTWKFAHKICGKLWFIIGCIILPVSIGSMCLIIGKETAVVGLFGGALAVVQILFMIIPIFSTEKALKKTFDENGYRRE